MNPVLLKALVALAPACLLLAGSVVFHFRAKQLCTVLQLIGAACVVVVVLTHVFEALQLFPWMQWGQEHSLGHYVDLSSAVVASTLFPGGYLLCALKRQPARQRARSSTDVWH